MPPSSSPIYDRIGRGYDRARRADPYILERLRFWLGLAARKRCLDAGCGTGNYTVELAAYGGDWHGVEQSERMVRAALGKSGAITWQRADILSLPYADASFDRVVITLALHHLRSLDLGIASLARVLRPGGRLVAFTSTAEQMAGYWLNHYFPDAMAKSIAQMPSRGAFDRAACSAGLTTLGSEPYFVREDLVDCFLYAGKHNPAIYFDSNVRGGISTFASLANREEVEAGCRRLASDLESGRFAEVAATYSGGGDYLFLAYGAGATP